MLQSSTCESGPSGSQPNQAIALMAWFTQACHRACVAWHGAWHMHGGSYSLTHSLHRYYVATCNSACSSFAVNLPGY